MTFVLFATSTAPVSKCQLSFIVKAPMNTRITVVVVLFGFVLLVVQSAAEQITSTCRITDVDSTGRAVTIVRKTADGEKRGRAMVADNAEIELDGKPIALEAIPVPVDASVIYDTQKRQLTSIKIASAP